MKRPGVVFAVLIAWIAVDECRILLFDHADLGLPFERGARNVVMGVAALLCIGRAIRLVHERTAWGLIGAGLLAWTAGDVYYSVVLWDLEVVPVPSWADVGYLLFPPCLLSGVVLLARSRAAGTSVALRADGAGAALAVAAIGAALLFEPVAAAAEGHPLEVATNLAYPVFDLLLLAGVCGALAARGWALDRGWICLALGAVAFGVADASYLLHSINDTATPESWYDFGWTLGLVLFAWAAWQPETSRLGAPDRLRTLVMPLTFATLGLGVLISGGFTSLGTPAIVLAALSVAAVGVRLVAVFRENAGMLAVTRDEALTDTLTGLGNRRALTRAVERALDGLPDDGRQWVLALFDLDGFKSYNDAFGHPAGDALLVRLGANLTACLGADGQAFRMGGDEFCVLMRAERGAEAAVVARTAAALSEHGEGFSIGSSYGIVLLPDEAGTVPAALRISDQRMYSHKRSGRSSAGSQSKDVLVRALAERNPDLSEHLAGVAEIARDTALALGLEDEEVQAVVHGAELHDVGKVAVPDAILNKPGPLDDAEWEFIRQHTVTGERIIAAAPALVGVAKLVRSSHERWDGRGYPDGLAGDAIPLGSRIIAVCDAYDAMRSARPYSAAISSAEALAEICRCAGAQFDPRVVTAFTGVIVAASTRERAPSPSLAER
jgi:diguanylate cyclase (GGDEF)-like protein